MDYNDTSVMTGRRHFSHLLLTGLLSLVFLSSLLLADDDTNHQTEAFPDTANLLAAVIQRETETDLELQSLVFKDDVTVSAFDGIGKLRTIRTETRYFNGSRYCPFALHITINEKSLNIPFDEVLGKSRLVPLQWSKLDETPVIVFSFEPRSPVANHGDLKGRIAGDMKGTVWVSPNDASIVRLEFRTVLPIALGKGFLGRIDSLEGFLQMREVASNLWLPTRQEFVTQGKNAVLVVAGVRFSKRFRTQQTDKLSRYAPALNLVQTQPSLLHYGD
jgi:hypothetical protein